MKLIAVLKTSPETGAIFRKPTFPEKRELSAVWTGLFFSLHAGWPKSNENDPFSASDRLSQIEVMLLDSPYVTDPISL
jgi:hypothetical protein